MLSSYYATGTPSVEHEEDLRSDDEGEPIEEEDILLVTEIISPQKGQGQSYSSYINSITTDRSRPAEDAPSTPIAFPNNLLTSTEVKEPSATPFTAQTPDLSTSTSK